MYTFPDGSIVPTCPETNCPWPVYPGRTKCDAHEESTMQISLDHPAIPYLQMLPTFYVGQQVINDGADEAFAFAMCYVESARITAFQKSVVEILPSDIHAEVWPGDSPGSDSYIHLPMVYGNSESPYIIASIADDDSGNYWIGVYDVDGNPAGDVIQITSPSVPDLVGAIEAFYRVLREPIDKINAMPED